MACEGKEFKGLMHFPKGNSDLELGDDKLKFSNIEECFDGFIVKTQNIKEWLMTIENVTLNEGKVLTRSDFGKDDLGRIKITDQTSFFWDDKEEKVKIVSNSWLLPSAFILRGKLKGNVKFEKEYNNDPQANYLEIAKAIAEVIIDKFDFYQKEERNEDGDLVVTERVITFNWDETGIIPKGEDSPYDIDKIEIEYQRNFDPPLPKEKIVKPVSKEFSFCNIDQVTIKNHEF